MANMFDRLVKNAGLLKEGEVPGALPAPNPDKFGGQQYKNIKEMLLHMSREWASGYVANLNKFDAKIRYNANYGWINQTYAKKMRELSALARKSFDEHIPNFIKALAAIPDKNSENYTGPTTEDNWHPLADVLPLSGLFKEFSRLTYNSQALSYSLEHLPFIYGKEAKAALSYLVKYVGPIRKSVAIYAGVVDSEPSPATERSKTMGEDEPSVPNALPAPNAPLGEDKPKPAPKPKKRPNDDNIAGMYKELTPPDVGQRRKVDEKARHAREIIQKRLEIEARLRYDHPEVRDA